jgi:uncharacterized membrane protein
MRSGPTGLRALHPLHPALAHFPLALWLCSAAADAAGFLGAGAQWWAWSHRALAAGLVLALPAVAAGAVELGLRRIPRAAVNSVAAHFACMLLAFLCFLISYGLRGGHAPSAPAAPTVALVFSALGVVAVLLGGWFGGTLVYRFGIGAQPGADPGGTP